MDQEKTVKKLMKSLEDQLDIELEPGQWSIIARHLEYTYVVGYEKNNKEHTGGIKKKKVWQLDQFGNKINFYNSVSEAARFIKGDSSAISKCIKGKNPKHKGYYWMEGD